MHLPYIGVAHVINETNTSNGVVEHPTSELNERTTDDFDDSWLHQDDTFQTIPMERTSTLYRAYGIVNYSYYSWIICIVSLLTFLHFFEPCDSSFAIVSGRAAEGERQRKVEQKVPQYDKYDI